MKQRSIVLQTDKEYKKEDIVVFYDGEIGREEQNIEAYTEGSFDGYVLFAEILTAEKKEDGTHLTFGYADPEAYLSDRSTFRSSAERRRIVSRSAAQPIRQSKPFPIITSWASS